MAEKKKTTKKTTKKGNAAPITGTVRPGDRGYPVELGKLLNGF